MNKKKANTHKKPVFIIVILTLLIALIVTFTIIISIKKHNDKTTTVLFYNLPDTIQQELQDKIVAIKSENIEFTSNPKDMELTNKVSKKYDLLFSWDNLQVNQLATTANTLKPQLYTMPTAIAKSGLIDGDLKKLPILLDNYEIAYYKTYRTKAKLQIPTTLASFEAYLKTIKEFAQYPLICAGNNDKTLLALISALTESSYGATGYKELVANCIQDSSFEKNLDKPLLSTKADTTIASPASLRTVLDLLKSWQQQELIMPKWYQVTDSDINAFMREHFLGAIFMSLSTHRTKEFVLIKYYDVERFPINQNIKNHALIAPVLQGILFNNTAGEQDILKGLLTDKNQAKLSTKTMLAPVTSRSVPNDRQADDVRFWAASCSAGPVTDLYNAAFTNPAEAALFAQNIRDYLRK